MCVQNVNNNNDDDDNDDNNTRILLGVNTLL
jgi:hypothetical protein